MSAAVPVEIGQVFNLDKVVLQRNELALTCIGGIPFGADKTLLQLLGKCVIIPHKNVVYLLPPLTIVAIPDDPLVAVSTPQDVAAPWLHRALREAVLQGLATYEQGIAFGASGESLSPLYSSTNLRLHRFFDWHRL